MIVLTRISEGVSRVLLPDGRVAIHRDSGDADYDARLTHLRCTLGDSYCPASIGDGLEEDLGDVTFRDALQDGLPLPLAMRIVRTIASAWHVLDEQGLAAAAALLGRRDIRLTSSGIRLLVTPTERPAPEDDPTIASAGAPRFQWMAPEVLRSGKSAASSMMFGVGLMLYEALTGDYPFRFTNDLDLVQCLLEDEVPQLPPTVPQPIARLVARCSQKKPADRFLTWASLLAAIDDAFTMHTGDDRPMIRAQKGLRIDLRPVTRADVARMRGGSDPSDAPVTGLTLEEAKAYAHWAKKRLPDSDEWEAAVRAVGAEALGVGAIWEYVQSERIDGGWTVRGGPWRDQRGPGHANNLSRSDSAPDVGFRCVSDD